jgi:DnaJ-class molecular chaperone
MVLLMSESLYQILEVPENATIEEIKKSYRRLSLLNHPDRNINNPNYDVTKYQKINEACEILTDPEKKQQYDMSRNNPFFKNQGPAHHAPNSVEEVFSNLFGMHFGGGGGPGGIHFAGGPGGGIHFGGPGGFPFGQNVQFFHNGVPVNMNFLQKPTPIVKNVIIPIDKILTGTTIPVDIERWITNTNNNEKTFENETIYVNVPKGMDEGEMILLKDKGNVVSEDCKGDVKIFVKIENNTEFKRMGLDLVLEKKITVKEALCGFSFEIKYITGKTYTVTNHSGNIIHHGYRKIIPNMGLSRDEHTGNLVIFFDIKFPEKLSNEVIESLKNIDF